MYLFVFGAGKNSLRKGHGKEKETEMERKEKGSAVSWCKH